MTIQPLTSTIGLVESDASSAVSEPEVIRIQPMSAKSRQSEEVKEMVENYVDEQTRRTSGKTNSHILSDTDNNPASLGSTPLCLSKEPTSSEIQTVRNEIAQIQSVIENVKKEMVQMQRQKSQSATALRPDSDCSNHTFNCDEEKQAPARPKTSMDMAKSEAMRPTTAKSPLKAVAPTQRLTTPDVLNDDQSSTSAYDPQQVAEEIREIIHDDLVQSKSLDEVDDYQNEIYEPESIVKEIEMEYEEEGATDMENMDAYSPAPVDIPVPYQRTPTSVKRQPPLKRSHKVTPVRNPMPNINQQSTVPVMAKYKVNNSLFPPSLRRFERPKDAIQMCLAQLDSPSWENVMDGLVIFVRLIRHHPEYVDTQIHLMTLTIAKHVKNLRSQVSRAACSAASEFFMTNAKALDAEAEELAAALLNRTADTNKFLRADALKALESMCDALVPSKVIMILTFRGAAHQNAAVKCATAKLLNQLVFRIGCDKVFNLHKDIRDKLIITGANLLMEGSLETRNYTKELFRQLSIHSHYHKLLLDVIPSNVYRNIEKSLKSIR